jgi:hypothetical protein
VGGYFSPTGFVDARNQACCERSQERIELKSAVESNDSNKLQRITH